MARPGFAREHLRSFIERIERMEEEKAALTADIREIYSEAKGQGFDTKIMRQVVRLRKLDRAEYQEQQAIFDLYWSALHGGSPVPDDVAAKVETILRDAEAREAA